MNEARQQEKNPPSGDQYIAAHFGALRQLPSNHPYNQVLQNIFSLRFDRRYSVSPYSSVSKFNEAGTSEMAGMERTINCYYLIQTIPGFRYEGYDAPEAWEPSFRAIGEMVLDPECNDDIAEHLEYNLMTRKVQTNIPQRYGPLELVFQLLSERFENKIEWLDVGSGIMEGPRQILLKNDYPLKFNEVRQLGYDGSEEKAAELTAKVNRIMNLPSIIKHCVGTDLQNVYLSRGEIYDPRTLEWCVASLRPKEFRDKAFMDRFLGLLKGEVHDRLSFQRVNLADETMVENFRKKSPVQSFDAISMITMSHQQTKADRVRQFEQAQALLKPGGIIFIQDFAYLRRPYRGRPQSIKALEIYSDWHSEPYRYNSFIYDSLRPDLGLQLIFQSRDSRSKELTLGAGKLCIKNELLPVSRVIESCYVKLERVTT